MQYKAIHPGERAGLLILGVALAAVLTGCLTTTAREPIPPPRVAEVDPDIQQHEPPIGEVAPIFWLDEPLVINGDFSKWDGMVSAVPRVMVYGGSYNPEITSGEFTVATDGSILYIYADITDNVPNENRYSPALAWRNDSVEIFIGADTGHRQSFAYNDSQIRLVPMSKDDPGLYGVAINDADRTDRVEAYVEYASHGYAIEAAIPLEELNILSLDPGRRVLLELQINDADRGERERMLHWMSPRDDAYYDPSSWGEGVVIRSEEVE